SPQLFLYRQSPKRKHQKSTLQPMPERIHGIKMNNNSSDLHYFGSHSETSSGFNTPTPPSAVPTYASSTTSKKYVVPPPRGRRYDNLNSTDGDRPGARDIETTKVR